MAHSPIPKPPYAVFGDAEGLVRVDHVPSTVSERATERRWQLQLLALFLLVTLGAGIVDTVLPVAFPPLAGDEKARRDARRESLSWLDGTWGRWIEEQRLLQSRVRHHLLPPYALLLYRGFGEVHGDLLHGRGGWLFLKDRVMPRPGSDAEVLNEAAQAMVQIQAFVESRGHQLLVVPIPRKAALAHEVLPRAVDPRPELDRQLPQALADHGIDVVDLLPVLEALPETRGETPYFGPDSHLAQSAMVEAAEVVAAHLGRHVDPAARRSTLKDLGRQPAEYDLLRFVGIRLTPLAQKLAGLEKRHRFQVLGPDGQPVSLPKEPTPGVEVVLVGTSFSAVTHWETLLAHAMDAPVVDMARPGENPFDVLQSWMAEDARSGDGTPKLVILEVPNYVFWNGYGLAPLENLPNPVHNR